MAIYTILIHCSLLFIWVAKYCSGQTDFNIQPFRTIHFVTANKTSDISIPYFNISVDTKTSLYFKIQTGCECSITLLQDGYRAVQIIIEDKEFDRSLKNGPIIHLSCHLFRNVNIFIRWEPDGFTLETVQLNGTTILRKTVINNTLGNAANQAIFSSAGKTEWTFYEADARRSVQTTISDQPAQLCPIFPQNRELPLHVSFLNGSSKCSEKMEVKTGCESQNIIIKYRCNDRGDVFSQYQSSSQRPLTSTEALSTTFSDSASYKTDVFSQYQSSSQRPLTTTEALPTTFSDSASYTTAGSMLTDGNKPDQISDNQKVIGLTVGASISAVIIVILLICLFVVLRRRSIERKSAKKNRTVQSSEDGNDYTGRQNIALPMQEDLSEYNELAMRRDSHQYGDLTSVGTKPNETTYDYIDHHKHKQETDICKIDKKNYIQDPGDELIHDYSVLDPDEKTINIVTVISNTGRDGDTYAVLDPDESTTLCSGTDNSDRLDKPLCESNNAHTKESTGSHTKDEAYAVLDSNITGFDRTGNAAKNESPETYTVLDPSITGFNRSDLTHTNGNMTKNRVNKNGLVQPFKDDGTDYEFAKPIDGDLSSKSCSPSNRDRTNSGGSYGTYQTGNTHRRQDINQQNPDENVYNRTVDDVYDSAAHQRLPTSRDDTYDYFSGEKKNDCGNT